jgi:hypothetical protein
MIPDPDPGSQGSNPISKKLKFTNPQQPKDENQNIIHIDFKLDDNKDDKKIVPTIEKSKNCMINYHNIL